MPYLMPVRAVALMTLEGVEPSTPASHHPQRLTDFCDSPNQPSGVARYYAPVLVFPPVPMEVGHDGKVGHSI